MLSQYWTIDHFYRLWVQFNDCLYRSSLYFSLLLYVKLSPFLALRGDSEKIFFSLVSLKNDNYCYCKVGRAIDKWGAIGKSQIDDFYRLWVKFLDCLYRSLHCFSLLHSLKLLLFQRKDSGYSSLTPLTALRQ